MAEHYVIIVLVLNKFFRNYMVSNNNQDQTITKNNKIVLILRNKLLQKVIKNV